MLTDPEVLLTLAGIVQLPVGALHLQCGLHGTLQENFQRNFKENSALLSSLGAPKTLPNSETSPMKDWLFVQVGSFCNEMSQVTLVSFCKDLYCTKDCGAVDSIPSFPPSCCFCL
jgi:hypothetical protein